MSFVAQVAIDAVSLGSLYALVALGIAIIFGIMTLINFAHGELIMVGAYTIFLLQNQPAIVLVLAPVLVVMLSALAMERIAFRPVRNATPTTLLVTSFALSYFLQNAARMIMGSLPKSVGVFPGLSEAFEVGGLRIPKIDVATLFVTAVLLIGLTLLLTRTRIGIQMRASAEDFRMARLLGVRANTVIAFAFAISGMLAGAVSILYVSQTGVVGPTMGVAPVLVGFVGTVIGGMNRLTTAALGGFFFGCMVVVLQAELPLELRTFRDAFAFTIVIAILLVRPQGLFGGRLAVARV
jgi:branched-chain amino acid transport system permease protein